jgi:pilus assembly protein CpaE
MRAVIAHSANVAVLSLRRALHGAGFTCEKRDCVPWDQLAIRLAQGDADLVVFRFDGQPDWDLRGLVEATCLTSAPTLAVGPKGNQEAIRASESVKSRGYIDESCIETGLDEALEQLQDNGLVQSERGSMFSVFSPTPGCGATTIAANLAGAFVKDKSRSVALLELSRSCGRLAMLLDIQPRHWAQQVCQRWRQMDQMSLRASLAEHRSGLRVLASDVNIPEGPQVTREAARRLSILARLSHQISIILLGSHLGCEELEIMRLSDKVILVLRADVPAVRRARWALAKALDEGADRDRFVIVVNRWGQKGQLAKDQLEPGVGMSIAEYLPDDPRQLNRAANEGRLVQELGRSRISRCLDALARKLTG